MHQHQEKSSNSKFVFRFVLFLLFIFNQKNRLEKLDQQVKEINTNSDALLKNFNELTELKFNLSMTQSFFEDVFAFSHQKKTLFLSQCICRVIQ